jgi:RNA polymerase sigma-70 factor (family 1)
LRLPPDDITIIQLLKEGNILSFDILYEKYHRKVYSFALAYLKNREDAEDVVQEVFHNLWRARNQINETDVFSRYLFKITFNEIHKSFRKKASTDRQVETYLKKVVFEDNTTDIDIEYNSLTQCAEGIIAKLPERQKQVFRLSVRENLTNEQIARRLNISTKTVGNHLSAAKIFIKKRLVDGGIISSLFFCLFLR